MPILTLNQWAGQDSGLSPYKQGAGQQLINALLGGIGQYQKITQDKLLRDAIKKEMGIDVPQGVDSAKLMETILKAKAEEGTFGGVAKRADQSNKIYEATGTRIPIDIPNLPGSTIASPATDIPGVAQATAPTIIPPTEDKIASEFDQWGNPKKFISRKALTEEKKIAEEAKGIDPMYKKQVEIFKDVLKHRSELEGLLFNQKEFQPGVKSWNPTRKENQRIQELLNEAQTAKKLLSARNVQGEDTSKMSIPGVGKGISMFANPEAMKMNLDDLYTTIEAATKNIQPGATTQAPMQGKVGKYTLIQ